MSEKRMRAVSYTHLDVYKRQAIQGMAYCAISMLLTRMISGYGAEAVATQRVGGQIESISWNTADGFAAALNAFIAQNYGAGKNDCLLYTSFLSQKNGKIDH